MSKRLVRWTVLVLGLGFLAMWPPSYFRYSAVGFDFDRVPTETMTHYYFRFRWPGDGSLRIGGGEICYALDEDDYDGLDPAVRLFEKPKLALFPPATFGFGLWSERDAYDDRGGVHRWARWLSIPAWLPALVLVGLRRRPEQVRDRTGPA